jgi:hypothetical protein
VPASVEEGGMSGMGVDASFRISEVHSGLVGGKGTYMEFVFEV